MKKWMALTLWKCLQVPLCISLIAAAGCQKKTDSSRLRQQELHLNLHSEPPCLDPRKSSDTTSISIINMCFEGLMSKSADGGLKEAVAESYSISDDKKIYTFLLREAFWSDGNPVTAFDFEKTWKDMMDPAFPCDFANDLYVIKNAEAAKMKKCSVLEIGVRALDAHTLVVELEHPTPYFLELTATHALYPAPTHITNAHADWAQDYSSRFVCNGPFRINEWRHHNFLSVVKNENYWDKECVKLEKITFAMIEDENTELSMFENGELDWAGSPLSNLPIDAMISLCKKGLVHTYPLAGVYYYVFNTRCPPFDNVNMRKAFALAINRQQIIENITQSGQLPATSIIPPTMRKDSREFFQDADVKEAQRYFQLALTELNITKEQLPKICLSYNTMSSHHKIAQAIQEQWFNAFGIRVELANKEWKVFLDELRGHQFQIARLGGIANVNDPMAFLHLYKYLSNSINHSQRTNADFTELVEKSENTTDPEERLALLKKAEEIFVGEMPIAPIYFYTGNYLKKPYVKGVVLSEMSEMDFKNAYVEK